ncbi:MAG: hypothetical protein E7193_02885 [Erysipelotrichaceae bacterium]|nr:hypothetical protein [Erysipelotrichaceae bacterium]
MISKRLRTIGDLIDNEENVTDVGCDHGLLAVYLRQKGNTAHLICADSKPGPLSQGRKNLNAMGIENVDMVLSDGLREIDEVTDVIVMAGMGYHTVQHIMTDSADKFAGCRKIIIQVNTDSDKMRRWLNEQGYRIIKERILKDYKYYEIIVVRKGRQYLSEEEIIFGPALLEEKSEVFRECYRTKRDKLARVVEKMPEDHEDRDGLLRQIAEIEKYAL